MARFASTIDNQPIYATRALNDKDGNQIDTTYAKLSDIPSVPVQDVTVDGTSVVNAQGVAEITTPTFTQVQSDWTETDSNDPAYIAHKPNLAAVATSGDYSDLSNTPTINNVPAVTSSDDNKVLKASYTGGVGSYSWENETGTTYTAGNGIDISNNEISVDTTVVATQTDLSSKQDTLTAGTNIQINGSTISATDTTYSAGTGIDITGTTISADTSVLATQTDLSSKQDELTAGSNIQINGTTISATDTTYSAGTGIDITGTTISADTSVLATQTDLSNKQDELTAGSNIQINGTTISATDTTYSAGTGIDITGTTISADTSVLATQTDLSSKQDELTAGSNITISNNTISATDTTYSAGTGISITSNAISVDNPLPSSTSADEGKVLKVDANGDPEWATGGGGSQVQSDWAEEDPLEPSFIENKPTPKTLVAGQGIAISESSASLTVTNTVARDAVNLVAGSGVTLTQSGSDLTISSSDTTYTAGDGIKISNQNVISADETVLWEDTPTTSMSLSETPANFEYLRVYVTRDTGVQLVGLAAATSNYLTFGMLHYDNSEGSPMQEITAAYTSSNGTTFTLVKTARRWYDGTTVSGNVNINTSYVTKIVGIKRIANN